MREEVEKAVVGWVEAAREVVEKAVAGWAMVARAASSNASLGERAEGGGWRVVLF